MKNIYLLLLFLCIPFVSKVFAETFDRKFLAAQPTVGASNITFTSISNTSANISWTSGNGTSRIVLIQEKEPLISAFFPQDGKSYTANSTFKKGSNVGYKMFAIYIGTGNNVTVTGLFNGTQYFVTVLEYNGTGTLTNYLQTPYPDANFWTTGPTEPTSQASGISFSNLTNNTMDITWTNGNGERRIVLIQEKTDLLSYYFPQDGKQYVANSVYKKGANVGHNMFAIYDGTANTVSVSGLFNGTTYYVTVLEYNGTGVETNYKLSPFPKGVVTTPGPTEPTVRPSNITFSNKTENSVRVQWNNGNGERRVVLVRERATTYDFFSPEDGKTYNATSVFGTGEYTGWVDTQDKRHYIVYNGTGNEFTLSGLKTHTEYYFSICEYNGTGTTSNYNRSIQTPSPVVRTLAPQPTVNATSLNFSDVANNSLRVNWTNGNGSERLLLASTNPITNTYFPIDGTNYTADNTYGVGSSVGWQTFVVYKGSGNSAPILGLSSGTTYYFAVVEYNGTGTESNYLSTGFLKGSQLTGGPTRPTVNATNLSVSNVTNSSMQLSWLNGNGVQRVVVASTNPLTLSYFTNDGSDYTGNSAFGSGSYLGPGTYVVYEGTGSSVNITGLSSGTNYNIAVVEFNGTGAETKYLTSGYLNGSQLTTGAARPTVNAANLVFSSVTNNSIQVDWTNGNGAQRVVVASTNPLTLSYFTNDGSDYTGNSVFGSGSYLGPGTYVIYEGTGSSVNITGLSSGTTYNIAVVEFNGTGAETKYLTSGYLNGSQLTTGATRPTVNATNLVFSSVTNNSIQVDWTNGNGAQRVVVASTGPFNMSYFTNDGKDYEGNTVFKTGSNLGSNTFVLYEGTGSSVNITGLISGTTYYIGVVEFNGTGIETKYLRSQFLQGTQITTGAVRPTINATNLVFSNISENSIKVDWINGNGEKRLVVASPNPLQEPFLPVDGKDYVANSIFSNGSHLGYNTFVIFEESGSSVTITGLASGTTYYIGVIEMNGINAETKYLKSNFLKGSQLTPAPNLRLASLSQTTDTEEETITTLDEKPYYEEVFSTLQLYPNPASEKVTIKLTLEHGENSNMIIYSLQGKMLLQSNFTGSIDEILDLNSFRKGVYIIKLESENHPVLTKQLIIK